ncbi:MAG: nitroreductase family protein [Spirochaetia bacterium]|jgi:nitroreductase|nr:nitroreductase family protein [Spirochaetia bacterium]
MNFHKLISERESIRSYDINRKIPKDILEGILDAGRLAPSAGNRQPWEFLLVSSNEMLGKIRPCYKADWFQAAPHILIVKGYKNLAWTRADDGYNALETDLTIAMDHMILAAENEGIGTCWIAAFTPKVLRESLELKENEEVYAITPLGYQIEGFQKKERKKRKSFDEVVRFI